MALFVSSENENYQFQKWLTAVSIILMIGKFIAWYLTNSVAVLTDALESIVNVMAAFIGLYSLYVAAKPRDSDHPYGHGKAEFLSAAIEGTLIFAAGIIIIFTAIKNLIVVVPIQQLDLGILLVSATGVVNLLVGYFAFKKGQRNNSMALIASGKHLLTDSYSTFGIIAGLFLLKFTGWQWVDSGVAIIFGAIITFTGYRITRRSIAGIMDEADIRLITRMVNLLNANRQSNWVDMHNLRIIKYGTVLHLDCHLTVPWYFNVNEAHTEIDILSALVRKEFGESLELFVHSDGCLYSQCTLCKKPDCPVRQHEFKLSINWALDNIQQNKKHTLDNEEV